jgi:hypothetical protein
MHERGARGPLTWSCCLLFPFGQGLAHRPRGAFALAVNSAGKASGLELGLDFFRPLGGIRPTLEGGVAAHQQLVHHLAVMYGGIADVIAPDQFVHAVDVDVILAAIVAFAMFLGPSNAREGGPCRL